MIIRKNKVEIKLPFLVAQEGAEEIVVTKWLAPLGGSLEIDQDLLELTVNGAVFILPSPLDGTLVAMLVEPGDLVEIEQTLAVAKVN